MCGYRFKGNKKNKKIKKRRKNKKRKEEWTCVSKWVWQLLWKYAMKVRKVMNDLSSHSDLLNFGFCFFFFLINS